MLDMGFEPQIKEEETATNELIHIQWQFVLIPLPRLGLWTFWKKFVFFYVFHEEPFSHSTFLYYVIYQEYLTDPVRVKVGKVSSPTANVAQFLVKVSDNEKVCLGS